MNYPSSHLDKEINPTDDPMPFHLELEQLFRRLMAKILREKTTNELIPFYPEMEHACTKKKLHMTQHTLTVNARSNSTAYTDPTPLDFCVAKTDVLDIC